MCQRSNWPSRAAGLAEVLVRLQMVVFLLVFLFSFELTWQGHVSSKGHWQLRDARLCQGCAFGRPAPHRPASRRPSDGGAQGRVVNRNWEWELRQPEECVSFLRARVVSVLWF